MKKYALKTYQQKQRQVQRMTQSLVLNIVTPSEVSCSSLELLEAKVPYNRFHSMLLFIRVYSEENNEGKKC